jgi:hypothetical protein
MYILSMGIGQKIDKPGSAEDIVKLLYHGNSASTSFSAEVAPQYG